MRVNVVTAFNGRGLERDAEVIEDLAHRAGHETHRVQWDDQTSARPADLSICLETMPDWSVPLAPRTWFIPNPEWYDPRWTPHLQRVERVLCKTRDAVRAFAPLTSRTELVGFLSRDRLDPDVPRERSFLCVAGVSIAKGADAAIEAWQTHRIGHPLTVVGRLYEGHPPVPGVTFRGHVADEELHRLQNAHRFHLCPSRSEGWGHTVHEAFSCEAVVAASDWPPLNEWPGVAVKIRVSEAHRQRLTPTCRASCGGVRDAVLACLEMSDEVAVGHGRAARRQFETERTAFEARMAELFAG